MGGEPYHRLPAGYGRLGGRGSQPGLDIRRFGLDIAVGLVGDESGRFDPERGAEILAARPINPAIAPDKNLPADTRLWAALQSISGGTWGGCVYDVERIVEVIEAGRQALSSP